MNRKTAAILLVALYASVGAMAYITGEEETNDRWRKRDQWQNVPGVIEAAGLDVLEARDPYVERPDDGDKMWLLVARRSPADRSACRPPSNPGSLRAATITRPI